VQLKASLWETRISPPIHTRAHVDSTLAGTVVKGDGEWRLEGDYPGTATLSFSQVDLVKLKPWLTTTQGEEASQFAGTMEGVLHIEGPALNWRANRAELRIPRLQLGPAPGVGIAAEAPTLTNSGPVVVRFANSILTVESAHVVGRGTDLNLSGRVDRAEESVGPARGWPADLACCRVSAALRPLEQSRSHCVFWLS
jgi:hypothetical protein